MVPTTEVSHHHRVSPTLASADQRVGEAQKDPRPGHQVCDTQFRAQDLRRHVQGLPRERGECARLGLEEGRLP